MAASISAGPSPPGRRPGRIEGGTALAATGGERDRTLYPARLNDGKSRAIFARSQRAVVPQPSFTQDGSGRRLHHQDESRLCFVTVDLHLTRKKRRYFNTLTILRKF